MWPYPWTHVGTPSHLGHIDRVAATMPSQAHAGAAQEAPDIGQWEGQDVPLVRPSSCFVKGGIPGPRRYLPTYLPWHARPICHYHCLHYSDRQARRNFLHHSFQNFIEHIRSLFPFSILCDLWRNFKHQCAL